MPVTNKKYFKGSIVNGWEIVEDLGGQRVKALCPECKKESEYSRAWSLAKIKRCSSCKHRSEMFPSGHDFGGWILVENFGKNRCLARCKRCSEEYDRQITGLKTSPGCRVCFPTNQKYGIGHVVGALRLLDRLENNRVRVQCVRCERIKEVSLPAFVQSKGACGSCSVIHNKKYYPGDMIHNWLLLDQIAPGIMKVKCLGPICGGAIFMRKPNSLIGSKGCRICYGFVKPKTQEARENQIAKFIERNKETHREFCEKHVGKQYFWLKIVGVDGKFFVCECAGTGPHLQSSHFRVRHNDVLMNRISSCGCMHKEKYAETMKKFYGISSMMDLPEHRQKIIAGLEKAKLEGSKPEKEILDFIRNELGVADATKIFIDGMEIDICSKSHGVGIEHDGLYWHSEGRIESRIHFSEEDTVESFESKRLDFARAYHIKRTLACERHQIRLIHVFGHEWKERKDQVKGFLRSVFKKNVHSVGGRECEVRAIPWVDAKEFLEKYHIQGAPGNASWHFGCFHNRELLYVATFSWHHRDSREGKVVELSRLCARPNWNVMGAVSKIMQAVVPILVSAGVERIVTWADRRYSSGDVYLRSGWKLEEMLPPDYFYYDDNHKRVISKQSRRKSVVNTPPEITELEHSLMDGLARVWDCGKFRFVYPIS